MANFHLVFIPSPGVGHLFSAVEFAERLVNRDDRLSVTVFVMSYPLRINQKLPSSSSRRIKFVHLTLETSVEEVLASKPPGITYSELVETNKPRVRDYVSSEVNHLSAFVVDMFCASFIDVANEFNVPTYAYFTSSAGFLSLIFHLQILEDEYNQDIYNKFKDSDEELSVPGFTNIVPVRVLPLVVIDKDSGFPNFLGVPRRLRETKGILINTFEELEFNTLKSLSEDSKIPHIYPIGPQLTSIKKHDEQEVGDGKTHQYADIMNWLGEQPLSSVVLICFGSMGSFGKDQIVEIANALEHSGHRFLWALRCPPPEGKRELPTEYENLNDVVPEGFLDRTSKQGKVAGWVPQMEILSHPAVGGFVSHCGWNSTLESLWSGIPLATWPLYAEQRINAFALVKELGLAVEIKMDYNKDMVLSSEEIEGGIRRLMDNNEYSSIRTKVKEMSETSKVAVEVGGSSYKAVGRFIEDLISN